MLDGVVDLEVREVPFDRDAILARRDDVHLVVDALLAGREDEALRPEWRYRVSRQIGGREGDGRGIVVPSTLGPRRLRARIQLQLGRRQPEIRRHKKFVARLPEYPPLDPQRRKIQRCGVGVGRPPVEICVGASRVGGQSCTLHILSCREWDWFGEIQLEAWSIGVPGIVVKVPSRVCPQSVGHAGGCLPTIGDLGQKCAGPRA